MTKFAEVNAYLNNPLLAQRGTKYEYTLEQAREIEKCKNDIQYFAENYMTIVHVDKGKMLIPLYEYQKKILDHFNDNRFSIVCQSRQSGKCVDINTIVNIRNKKSGIIEKITIGQFYERQKISNKTNM